MIEVADEVQDRITGFKGIAIARTEWLNGCVRLTVQPQELKDGKPIDAQAFDEEQLALLEKGKGRAKAPTGAPVIPAKTGGPHPEPARASDPTR